MILISESLSLINSKFALIRAGVTLLAKTELPRATRAVRKCPYIETSQALTVITQQHTRRRDVPFLCDFDNGSCTEHWSSSTTQRAICCDMDALRFAEVNNILLRKRWVIFDLVDGRNDSGLREQLFEVFYAVVRNSNCLHLARCQQLLHSLPRLYVRPVFYKIAGAVGEFGESLVVSCLLLASVHSGEVKTLPFGFMATGQCMRYKST
jgi:hypothetical protein